jgi:hypothetical protein
MHVERLGTGTIQLYKLRNLDVHFVSLGPEMIQCYKFRDHQCILLLFH